MTTACRPKPGRPSPKGAPISSYEPGSGFMFPEGDALGSSVWLGISARVASEYEVDLAKLRKVYVGNSPGSSRDTEITRSQSRHASTATAATSPEAARSCRAHATRCVRGCSTRRISHRRTQECGLAQERTRSCQSRKGALLSHLQQGARMGIYRGAESMRGRARLHFCIQVEEEHLGSG